MEPKSGNNFEQPSVPAEYGPVVPEYGQNPNERERQHEAAPVERESSAPPLPPTLPIPVIPLPEPVNTPQTSTPTTSSSNPATAADDDLIEKEWVDKAKKIIAETRDDPYKRERAINQLQADYLKKRYGKTLGGDE